MNVGTARNWVRENARDAKGNDTGYSPAQIDRAVQTVGQRFCRETRLLRRADTVLCTISTDVVTITAIVTAGFRPEQLVDVYIAGQAEPLSVVDYTQMNAYQSDQPLEAPPTAIAFPTAATCQVYPTPDAARVLTVRWWEQFTVWTPGDSASDATVLAVPDRFLPELLTWGATAVLQHADPKHKYGAEAWAKYRQFEQRCIGAGTLGAKVLLRDRRE